MKQLVDSGVLISAIRSLDPHHWQCSSYLRNHSRHHWVIPATAYFEYQCTQSRLKREASEPYRELFLADWEVYDISFNLMRKAAELDLINLFSTLSGSNLICACIAKIEQMPLVSCNEQLRDYAAHVEVLNPLVGEK